MAKDQRPNECTSRHLLVRFTDGRLASAPPALRAARRRGGRQQSRGSAADRLATVCRVAMAGEESGSSQSVYEAVDGSCSLSCSVLVRHRGAALLRGGWSREGAPDLAGADDVIAHPHDLEALARRLRSV